MSSGAVCYERKFVIPNADVDEVFSACQKAFKNMGLRVMNTEKSSDGSETVLAGERALVPLTIRTLLYPLSIQHYVKAAQRSGIHVVISPSKAGTLLYFCGLMLDEITGKPMEDLSDADMDDITNTMEALDFENKFLTKIREMFPTMKEAE